MTYFRQDLSRNDYFKQSFYLVLLTTDAQKVMNFPVAVHLGQVIAREVDS
jgi:hypothetical protein